MCERIACGVAEHAARHGRDPVRMARLAWLAVCRRELRAARDEYIAAAAELHRRCETSRRATARVEDACRRYDPAGIARVRAETADAHARVPRVQARLQRARALLDDWSAEAIASAREVAALERRDEDARLAAAAAEAET